MKIKVDFKLLAGFCILNFLTLWIENLVIGLIPTLSSIEAFSGLFWISIRILNFYLINKKVLSLENCFSCNRRFSLLKGRTHIKQDIQKLTQSILNFYKGTNSDHFDGMLKEISQVTFIQENDAAHEHVMTDELYQLPFSSVLSQFT